MNRNFLIVSALGLALLVTGTILYQRGFFNEVQKFAGLQTPQNNLTTPIPNSTPIPVQNSTGNSTSTALPILTTKPSINGLGRERGDD